ncbi:MAG: PQQ-binding-like beta-propeller repeat protein [Pirellulaceae bacterium]
MAEGNQTHQAFDYYNRLTRRFGDLGARKPLRELMQNVSEREVNLVTPVDVDISVSTVDDSGLVTDYVMISSQHGNSLSAIQDEVLPFLIDGYVYGVSGLNGEVLWSRFVGYETTILPIWVDEASRQDLLVSNQLDNTLLRVNARTGELQWQATLGEPFLAPVIRGDLLVVSFRSGNIVRLNPGSGEVLAAVHIPKNITTSVEISEQSPFIYVVGADSNIYILTAEELKCVETFYLGHSPNDIRIPPIYWTGHLLVNVNGSDFSDLHVFRLNENGMGLERIQLIRLASAPVSMPPQRLGRNMLFAADNGQFKLLELVVAEADMPIFDAAVNTFDKRGAAVAYVFAQGSRMWIGANGLQSFRIDKNRGDFTRLAITSASDTFLAPIVKFENVLVHARRRGNSRQVSVAAVDMDSLEEFWRSDFGAPLPTAPIANGDRVMTMSAQGDLFEIIDSDTGKVINRDASASAIDEPLNITRSVVTSDNIIAGIGNRDSADLVLANLDTTKTSLSRLSFNSEPLKPSSAPVALSTDFVIPSEDGLLVRLGTDGLEIGTPFSPPIEPGQGIGWSNALANAADHILIADDQQNLYLIDASDRSGLNQLGSLTVDGQIDPRIASDGATAYFISKSGAKAQLRATGFDMPLVEKFSIELPALPVSGPMCVGGMILLHLDDGKIYAWDSNGMAKWNQPAPNVSISGCVQFDGDSRIFVVFEDGRLVALDANGAIKGEWNLGMAVRNIPVAVGDSVYFNTANGAIVTIDRSSLN